MEGVQVGLALQLDSSAQGCYRAAPEPLRNAAELAAQLQQLLHLAHLHLVVGFGPAAQPGRDDGKGEGKGAGRPQDMYWL